MKNLEQKNIQFLDEINKNTLKIFRFYQVYYFKKDDLNHRYHENNYL